MEVQEFLTQHHVPFREIAHPATFGALRVAQSMQCSGKVVAKSVVLEVDGEPVLAVLPATRRVNLADVKELLGSSDVVLATEARCHELFSDCDVGALPPFGSMHGMRTIMDRSLLAGNDIAFESNHHDKGIRLRRADYERIESPLIGNFSLPVDA